MPGTGIGIVTYKRPQNLQKILRAILEPDFRSHYDFLVIYNDGSEKSSYEHVYQELLEQQNVSVFHPDHNAGVATAKNVCLDYMMDQSADYMFLLEDDIVPHDTRCITSYIEACHKTGIEHFNFAHHGPANENGPIRVDEENGIDYYTNIIGAWSFYTRNVIDTVGYLDENFYNAIDHCEHTWRISQAGLTSPFWYFADVHGSQYWFTELGTMRDSVIRMDGNWLQNTEKAKAYWRTKDPNCPL